MPIVSDATTLTDNITVNSFIMLVNESLYCGKKFDHSLINSNKLRCHGTMVWDNTFDPNSYICLETCKGVTIDIVTEGTKILFSMHVPTE